MAIITTAEYLAWANKTMTGTELASLGVIVTATCNAIKERLKRTLEQDTFEIVLSAPMTPLISLARYAPITVPGEDDTLFKCWLNYEANGNPDAFDDDDDLLELYTDYTINLPDASDPFGPCLVQKISGFWGVGGYYPPYRLTGRNTAVSGAVKFSFQGGWPAASIPPDIKQAAYLLVSMTMANRRFGFMVGSESWNGYNYNIPGVGLLSNGLMGNPDVVSLLNPYINFAAAIG